MYIIFLSSTCSKNCCGFCRFGCGVLDLLVRYYCGTHGTPVNDALAE